MILSFNYTAAREDHTLDYFNTCFIVIILINIFSFFYYLLNVWIDIRIGKFDTNILKIHHFIYITCPIGNVVLIAQKLLILLGKPEGYNVDNPMFQVLHHLRTSTVFPGLICLMAFVIERFCATLFLKDYEKRNRSWVGIFIGIGLYTVSGLLSYSLALVSTSLYHTIFVLVLSIASCMGNCINYKLNRKYYKACQRSFDGSYSLAERYQISDNIHFSFFFNRFALSISFFTVLCSLLMLAASFDTEPCYRNLFISLFEFSFSVYTILTPYIIYKFNLRWHQEFRKVFRKFTLRFREKRIDAADAINDANDVPLRNTFGVAMNIDIKNQSNTHFDQLQELWNVQRA